MSQNVPPLRLTLGVMIPDLLSRYPEARAVLDRYGLRGCGGMDGPRESLAFFARVHGVDQAALMDELRRAIYHGGAHPQSAAAAYGGRAAARAATGAADAIYRPYFLGAMAVVLTAGAFWGAWLLWQIGVAGDFHAAGLHAVNAHGHAQIFGWVGLFIMGFALQALPRMWHVDLPGPRLARAALVLMLAGLAMRTMGMGYGGTGATWAVGAMLAGGAAELAAIAIFTWILITAFHQRTVAFEPWMAFVLAGIGWFVVQAVFGLWHTWMTMTAFSAEALVWVVSTYQAPLRDMQIHGMALFMILGVSIRMLPALFGVAGLSARRTWAGWGMLMAAVIAEVAIFLAYRLTGDHLLARWLMGAWLLLAAGVAVVVLPWRLWRPMATRDRSAKFIRIAYAWLGVSLAMLLLMPAWLALVAVPFSHAYYGAVRHAITVGFISMMILGMAAKVVPTLRGRDPLSLTGLWGPFLLVNAGCLLRVSTQVLTDVQTASFAVIGVSGTLEVIGLAWWSVHLAQVMLVSAPPRPAGPRPSRIAGEHLVGHVLAWDAGAQAVLEAAGFKLLRNPVARQAFASRVTLAQACAMLAVPLEPLLARLNEDGDAAGASGATAEAGGAADGA